MKVYFANDWTIQKDMINIEFLSLHFEAGCNTFIFWVTIAGISLVIEKEIN